MHPGSVFLRSYVISSSVRLLLLAVSWRAVRRQGREFLALLWMLETVTAAFGLTVNSAHLALGRDAPITPVLFTVPLSVATSDSSSTSIGVGYLATSPVYLVATLWFARRASRISAGHALLLVLLSSARFEFHRAPLRIVRPGLVCGRYRPVPSGSTGGSQHRHALGDGAVRCKRDAHSMALDDGKSSAGCSCGGWHST